MKRSKLLLIFALLVSAMILSACGAVQASSWSGLTADGDIVYLASNARVYAVNINTRQQLWRFPEKTQNGLTFHAAPVLTPDGQLLAGSYGPSGYNLYSLNPTNGALNWTFSNAKNNYVASPLAAKDRIYAPNSDGNLYALDSKGVLLWTFHSPKALWATPAINSQCDCLFLSSMDHSIYALDAETGQQKWQTDLGGAIVATPTFSEDGVVFVGTFASELVALNAADGRVVWRYPTEGWVWTQPNLVDGVLYAGDSKGNLFALNPADGKEIWKTKGAGTIVSQPLVLNENIFFTAGTDSVYAYSRDGSNLWQHDDTVTTWPGKLEGQLLGNVVAAGGNLLVSPLNSQTALFVLNMDGAQQWAFIPEK